MLVKERIRKSIGLAVVAALAFAVLLSPQTSAQSVNNSTNVIKISPVRTDIQIAPGESKTVQMTVTNLTNDPILVAPVQNDFISGDESGTPALILDADEYAPTHSLKRFMQPIANVTIPAQKSVTIDVVIKVPAGTQAGGYFGAIRFAPTVPGSGGQVNLSPNAASLILLSVPGPVTEKLDLTDFRIQQSGKNGNFFGNSEGISAFIRFENKGNIQEGPFGKIIVKNFGKVVSDIDFNTVSPRDQILPDAARRWDVLLKDLGSFGYYTVSGTLTYGQKNQTIDVTTSFWIIPQIVIIIAIAALLLIIGLIVFLIFFIRNRRRRNRRPNHMSRYRR